jgi:hypothetical protein
MGKNRKNGARSICDSSDKAFITDGTYNAGLDAQDDRYVGKKARVKKKRAVAVAPPSLCVAARDVMHRLLQG